MIVVVALGIIGRRVYSSGYGGSAVSVLADHSPVTVIVDGGKPLTIAAHHSAETDLAHGEHIVTLTANRITETRIHQTTQNCPPRRLSVAAANETDTEHMFNEVPMVALALPFPTASHPTLCAYSPTRTALTDTAFVDHHRAWVRGTEPLFEMLRNGVSWHSHRRTMYDRVVDVPRLLGSFDGDKPTIVRDMQQALDPHYQVSLDRVSLARYRDGNDSVAWHGDRLGTHIPWSVVAVVSIGGPRRFLLRPKGGGKSLALTLGSGDVLVLGGDVQATFEHCVPKTTTAAPRIALMFRHSTPWTAGHAHDNVITPITSCA
ncbi:MAG: alkylated DNA repair dioxygenase AlkB [Myxococcota bacterium]